MYDLCVDSIDHEENGRSLVLLDLSAAFDMLDHGVVYFPTRALTPYHLSSTKPVNLS